MSASGCSLVQRFPTECGVSECDHEASIMKRPWLTRGCCSMEGDYSIILYAPTSITLKNSTFCPHTVFMCFVWISEQTAIISLYSTNWLVFITEKESVYCAVRAEFLYIIKAVFCIDLRTNSDYFSIQC